ncbi:hypothetical protein E0K83_15755 [Gramella sp. BOM4]|nr:hypothetical protein [Christiangramia bathymodioli]
MDNLDLLKKDWKKQEANLPHLSYEQLYKMIWNRSSSITKWIFFISIIEFLGMSLLNIFLADEELYAQLELYNLTNFNIIYNILHYGITFFFIYRFYINYKKINATDNASQLMDSIMRTRKTVKNYIGFVLISGAVAFTIAMIIIAKSDNLIPGEQTSEVFGLTEWLIFIGVSVLMLAILLGGLWLLYRLIYGILLRRLYKNYKELKRLEME